MIMRRSNMLPSAALLLTVVACSAGTATHEPAGTVSERRPVYVWSSDNALREFQIGDGSLQRQLQLSPRSNSRLSLSHALVISPDKQRLAVLLHAGGDSRFQIVIVSVSSWSRIRQVRLDAGISYTALASGPATGRLYALGYRASEVAGVEGGSSIVTVVDPDGSSSSSWLLRASPGRGWMPYQGIVTTDEKRLLVSYHGPDTSGIDWYDLDPEPGVRPCPDARPAAGRACLATHGGFALLTDGLLATTGEPALERYDPSFHRVHTYDSRLAGNHIMEIATSQDEKSVFVLGSCGYAGGLSRIDLGTGQTTLLSNPAASRPNENPRVCGDRIEVYGPAAVLARRPVPDPLPDEDGRVDFFDLQRRSLYATRDMKGYPVDLVIA